MSLTAYTPGFCGYVQITRYTSMAMTPQLKKSALKAIQVVPIEPGKAMV